MFLLLNGLCECVIIMAVLGAGKYKEGNDFC